MKDFSLILPTRERPMLVKRLLDSVVETVSDPGRLEIVLYVDEDDTESRNISHPSLHIVSQTGPSPRKTMGNIIKDCYKASCGRFVMLINDDVVFRTKDWDNRLLEAFSRFDDGVALVYGKDLYYDEQMCTFPVLPRMTCDLMDGICPGEYDSHCIDSHIFDTFKRLTELGHDRSVYLDDVVFEHMHYELVASAYEDGPERKNDRDDQAVYLSLADDRQRAAMRMAQYIESHDNTAAGKENEQVDDLGGDRPAETPISEKKPVPLSQSSVSVIMPVSDDSIEYALACLKAVLEGNENKMISVELVVVADGKACDASKYPRKVRKKLNLVSAEQVGSSGSFNAGASAAAGDYLVFLDSGSFPQSGWLEALLEAAQGQDVGIVGSKWLNARNGRVEHVGIGFHKDNGVLKGTHIYKGLAANHPAVNRTREVQAVRSTGMLVKRDAFLNAGCFDNALGGLEDIDLCLKVRQAGQKVICAPAASLYCQDQNVLGECPELDDKIPTLESKWDGGIEPDMKKLLAEDGFVIRSRKKSHFICPGKEKLEQLENPDNSLDETKRILQGSLELAKSLGADKKDLAAICRKLVDVHFSLGSEEDVQKIHRMMQVYGLSVPVALSRYERMVRTDRRNLGTVESVDMYVGTRFVIPVAAAVCEIEMKMYKSGTPGDDIVAYIYRDDEGPSKPVVSSGSEPVSAREISTNPGGEWIKFTFPGPVELSPNTYYWILLHRAGAANNASHYRILLDSSPDCRYRYASDYYGPQATGGNVSDRISQLFRITGIPAPEPCKKNHGRKKTSAKKSGKSYGKKEKVSRRKHRAGS